MPVDKVGVLGRILVLKLPQNGVLPVLCWILYLCVCSLFCNPPFFALWDPDDFSGHTPFLSSLSCTCCSEPLLVLQRERGSSGFLEIDPLCVSLCQICQFPRWPPHYSLFKIKIVYLRYITWYTWWKDYYCQVNEYISSHSYQCFWCWNLLSSCVSHVQYSFINCTHPVCTWDLWMYLSYVIVTSYLLTSISPFPPPPQLLVTNILPCALWVQLFFSFFFLKITPISEFIQHFSFFVWLISLHVL